MPLISANGVRIHVTDTGGDAGAPTVVFGHGLLFSGHMFRAQIERIESAYRCVTIDWRGQGKTPATPDGYDMETLYDDAVAVIEGLGVGAVHYVGLSMGGFIGLRLGARRPDLIRTLSLFDTSAGPEDLDKVARYRRLAGIYRWVGIKPLESRVKPLMFGPAFLADPAARPAIDEWRQVLRGVDRSGLKRAILGVADRFAVFNELASITAPTQVVVGAEDVATPLATAEAIVAGIGGATLTTVPDCGHSSTVEQPAVLADLLEKFLATHS